MGSLIGQTTDYMAKSYDLGEQFENGAHLERSVAVADQSFEVVFRVDLACPQCASPATLRR